MTGPSRSRSTTITGRTLVAVGAAIVLLWALLLGSAYSGDYSTAHTMTTTPGYLNGDARDDARKCRVTPANGEPRDITVPAMPQRGIDINGARIDAWFEGEAAIACDQPTRFTQGTLVRFHPLVEQWIVLLVGLLIAGGGLYQLGLFRHVSRYP
ncbi:hypothetical protein [Actinoplanes sp. NPDC049118]|uniref:hypothetical protein n=1 Tax=Actinoplanes sp. NPDC049118 TaxID=3155769 RepID=UPI0033E3C62B